MAEHGVEFHVKAFTVVVGPLTEGGFVLEAEPFGDGIAFGVGGRAKNFDAVQLEVFEAVVQKGSTPPGDESLALGVFGEPVANLCAGGTRLDILEAQGADEVIAIPDAGGDGVSVDEFPADAVNKVQAIRGFIDVIEPGQELAEVVAVLVGEGE